jgi:hypothetical protein
MRQGTETPKKPGKETQEKLAKVLVAVSNGVPVGVGVRILESFIAYLCVYTWGGSCHQ